jgi:uncharacterized protein
METQVHSGRRLRGFASMSKDRQKQIASHGGRVAHEKGAAHEFNSVEASMAARKGHERGTAHEFTTQEARLAGRKGGLARAQKHRSQQPPPQQHNEPPATPPQESADTGGTPSMNWMVDRGNNP